jgi:hypothetical protein
MNYAKGNDIKTYAFVQVVMRCYHHIELQTMWLIVKNLDECMKMLV